MGNVKPSIIDSLKRNQKIVINPYVTIRRSSRGNLVVEHYGWSRRGIKDAITALRAAYCESDEMLCLHCGIVRKRSEYPMTKARGNVYPRAYCKHCYSFQKAQWSDSHPHYREYRRNYMREWMRLRGGAQAYRFRRYAQRVLREIAA